MTQPPTDALRLVPVEPTEAMLNAAIEGFPRSHPSVFPIIYRYMIDAAPASPLPGGGWQDISTAPKDGTEVLIKTREGCISCSWDQLNNEWEAGWLGISLLPKDPIGWMPLPAAPTGEPK